MALALQEGGKLVTEVMKFATRNREQKEIVAARSEVEIIEPAQEEKKAAEEAPAKSKATAIPTGCIPCSLGHVGTCSGLLNEAMRFARTDGMASPEVIDRVNICLDELNALERVDLRPEMTVNLQGKEKELATEALVQSKAIRHNLENLKTIDDLEKTAARTQEIRSHIGREWFQNKLSTMPESQKAAIMDKVAAKLKDGA